MQLNLLDKPTLESLLIFPASGTGESLHWVPLSLGLSCPLLLYGRQIHFRAGSQCSQRLGDRLPHLGVAYSSREGPCIRPPRPGTVYRQPAANSSTVMLHVGLNRRVLLPLARSAGAPAFVPASPPPHTHLFALKRTGEGALGETQDGGCWPNCLRALQTALPTETKASLEGNARRGTRRHALGGLLCWVSLLGTMRWLFVICGEWR